MSSSKEPSSSRYALHSRSGSLASRLASRPLPSTTLGGPHNLPVAVSSMPPPMAKSISAGPVAYPPKNTLDTICGRFGLNGPSAPTRRDSQKRFSFAEPTPSVPPTPTYSASSLMSTGSNTLERTTSRLRRPLSAIESSSFNYHYLPSDETTSFHRLDPLSEHGSPTGLVAFEFPSISAQTLM